VIRLDLIRERADSLLCPICKKVSIDTKTVYYKTSTGDLIAVKICKHHQYPEEAKT